jgi:hypothetical protein
MSDIKTGTEIEADFYRRVKTSPLAEVIRGRVLRDGMRERDARTEDAVVIFNSGLDGQVQDGVVVLNVFVPKRPFGVDTEAVKDIGRVSELEGIIRDWLSSWNDEEYLLPADRRPTILSIDDPQRGETYIHTRIRFKRLAE